MKIKVECDRCDGEAVEITVMSLRMELHAGGWTEHEIDHALAEAIVAPGVLGPFYLRCTAWPPAWRGLLPGTPRVVTGATGATS